MRAAAVRFPGAAEHAPDGRLLWVDVDAQRLWVLESFRAVACMRCSTASRGLGEREGSFQTPRGWHEVAERIGGDLPTGAVLRSRRWTGERWSPPAAPDAPDAAGGVEDLVLTRILWLEGLEPGVNRGGEVDSRRRYIYIHGTNQPDRLGVPASHGCVRLACRDVIALHDRIDAGHRVWIG